MSSLINHLNEPGLPGLQEQRPAREKQPRNIHSCLKKFHGDRTWIKVRADIDWTDRAINFVIRLSCYDSPVNLACPVKMPGRTTSPLCTILIGANLADFRARRKRGLVCLPNWTLFVPLGARDVKGGYEFFIERGEACETLCNIFYISNTHFHFFLKND